MNKVSDEVRAFVQKHTDTTSSDPLYKRLAAIPMSVWEEEMPALDAVLRETLRLSLNFAALRRNLFKDLHVSGDVIPKGDFLTYLVSDVHLNPDIYTKPMAFDPDRFSGSREEHKKQPYAFLGWGVGE